MKCGRQNKRFLICGAMQNFANKEKKKGPLKVIILSDPHPLHSNFFLHVPPLMPYFLACPPPSHIPPAPLPHKKWRVHNVILFESCQQQQPKK